MHNVIRDQSESKASAEDVAVQALIFLAGDQELLQRFLALTGIEAGQIRDAAREPGFLAGVLNFFLAHEPSLMKLCDAIGSEPATINAAVKLLPAGEDSFERST
jgi:hypothetical protein